MKQDKHTLTYKKYIKAEKRLNEIYEELRKAPKVAIKEPYQSGWTLSIKLRDDFARSAKGPIVQSLIDRFGRDNYTRSPKLVSEIRKKPALQDVRALMARNHNHYYWYNSPHIKTLTREEFDKLTPHEKTYFTYYKQEPVNSAWGRAQDCWDINIPYHYLIVRITKRMITHAKELDTALLKEKAELQKILAPYWRTSGSYHWKDCYFDNRAERRQSKVDLTKIDIDEIQDA